MIRHRTAITRHARRHNPHGLPAAALIADQLPAPAAVAALDETAPLFLPGLLPALAVR